MIHVHGTPMGGKREEVARILAGRFALIPFGREEDLPIAAEVCRGFAFDNGAYTAWQSGQPIEDWAPYYELVERWSRHPRYMGAMMPDVIDGTEEENDRLEIKAIGKMKVGGICVWHMHETTERLARLCRLYPIVALGSSGEFATVGTEAWWGRMSEAMQAICDDQGRPRTKLWGLRMLDPEIFTRLPLSFADSCNVAQNKTRPFRVYEPPTPVQKAECIAARIECHQSAAVWEPREAEQLKLWR